MTYSVLKVPLNPNQPTNQPALSGKTQKHENHIFSLKCFLTALPDFK